MYDAIIIGGGIAGLNCALQLSKNNNILLLDNRTYLGGRIRTNKKPVYEIGGARFNDSHKRLIKLINNYALQTYKLNKNIDFADKKTKKIKHNVNNDIESFFKEIIQKSQGLSKKKLMTMTFKELCLLYKSTIIVNKIIAFFGYSSEFNSLNAYDALRCIKGDFNGNKFYYIIQGGLSILCNKMSDDIRNNGGKIKLKTIVNKVEELNENFLVSDTMGRKWIGQKIIFTVKPHQLKTFPIIKSVHSYIHSVNRIPLIRIYAKYNTGKNGVWFKGMHRTTTDSFLRHIIPINEATGLIMISYTDDKDTKVYFKNNKLLATSVIKAKIHKEVCALFPNKSIPKPTYFKCHLWTEGVHFWKKNADSKKIFKKILQPRKNIFICGEGFSLNQAWIEGALDTSDRVIELINKFA